MIFDLVADDVGAMDFDRLAQQRDGEIAHADETRLALGARFGEGAQRFSQRFAAARPMDQQKVDVVAAETLEALLDVAADLRRAQLAHRHLRGDEDFGALHAGIVDRRADLGFVVVKLGGVDVAIADGERGAYGVVTAAAGKRPGADAECRQLRALGRNKLHTSFPSQGDGRRLACTSQAKGKTCAFWFWVRAPSAVISAAAWSRAAPTSRSWCATGAALRSLATACWS